MLAVSNMTVGQQFAMQWLAKNAPLKPARGQPPVDPVERCELIAAAVDRWAEEKRQEFEDALRRVVNGVHDNADIAEPVRVTGRDLRSHSCLCLLAQQWSGNMSAVTEFPLHS